MPEPCYTIDKGQGKAKSKTDERDEDLNRKEVSGLGTSDMIARFIQAELEEANGDVFQFHGEAPFGYT